MIVIAATTRAVASPVWHGLSHRRRPVKMKLAKKRVRTIRDRRGMLRIFEKGASLPFALKRCFVISHVPKGKARGEHAVSCSLFLTELTGTCRLTVPQRRARGKPVTVAPNRRRGRAERHMAATRPVLARIDGPRVCVTEFSQYTLSFAAERG